MVLVSSIWLGKRCECWEELSHLHVALLIPQEIYWGPPSLVDLGLRKQSMLGHLHIKRCNLYRDSNQRGTAKGKYGDLVLAGDKSNLISRSPSSRQFKNDLGEEYNKLIYLWWEVLESLLQFYACCLDSLVLENTLTCSRDEDSLWFFYQIWEGILKKDVLLERQKKLKWGLARHPYYACNWHL